MHGLDEWYVKQPLSGWERTPGGVNTPDTDQRVVQDALGRGVRNLRQLTAMIFFARHPSQRTEWIEIRDRIARPALQQTARRNGVFINRGGVR
jgi:hypothetical protein